MSKPQPSETFTMPEVYYSSALKMRARRSKAPFVNKLKVAWDPAWLDGDAFSYNSKLAIAALGLCMSSYANVPSNDFRYVKTTFENFGFRDIDITSYAHRTEEDPSDFDVSVDLVAYAFARFDVPCADGKIAPGVVCIVRGTSATIEWNSNANLADSVKDGDYSGVRYVEGFRMPELEMVGELKAYLARHEIDEQEVRILAAGHSRGACVANILGADLDEAATGVSDDPDAYRISADPEHVYVYTFASSGTTLREDAHDAKFGNIFNLVYPEDFIPRVPLAAWGFTRFGTTCYLPSIDTSFALFKRVRDATYAMFELVSDTTQIPFHGSYPTDAFVRNGNNLCGSLEEYYTLRHMGSGRRYTFREYFELFTNQCAQHGLAKLHVQAKLLLASRGAYGPFLEYFMVHEVAKMTIPFIHAAEAYMSRLTVLDRMEIDPADWMKSDVQRITLYGPLDVEVTYAGETVGRIVDGKCDETLYGLVGSVAVAVDRETDSKMVWVPTDGFCEVAFTRNAAGSTDSASESIDVYATVARLAPEGETIVEAAYTEHGMASGEQRKWDHPAPALPELSDRAPNSGMAQELAAAASPKANVSATIDGPGDAVGIRDANPSDIVCVHAYDDGLSKFLGWHDGSGERVSKDKKYVLSATAHKNLIAKFKL